MFFYCRLHDQLRWNVLSEIENIVTVILKQNLDDIFSDVVNIALYGCKDDRSLLLLLLCLALFTPAPLSDL